ncbi:MAG TPA: serine/threonine-protein kinase, partial [Kofleriaceae bacterium]|nr:serine/threonine-protein kinase [Kofleriaceae bacterium]
MPDAEGNIGEVPTAPASQAPEAAPREDARDRYILVERLGEGATGVVWAARDGRLDRMVALKVLHDEYLGAVDQEQLAAEARAMAKLSHPNVVAVYDAGEREGRAFVTMELVSGPPLSRWLDTPRSWREIVDVFRAAGEGLAAAHEAGLVHRDVKPSNILVGDDGRARIADFGLAHAGAAPVPGDVRIDAPVTRTTAFAGTPAYMPPERLRGAPADVRGDQFAFCVALYEALAGKRPFGGDTVEALLAAMDAGPPPPLRHVPRWLDAAVARGLAPSRDERFASMRDLLAALRGPRRR